MKKHGIIQRRKKKIIGLSGVGSLSVILYGHFVFCLRARELGGLRYTLVRLNISACVVVAMWLSRLNGFGGFARAD